MSEPRNGPWWMHIDGTEPSVSECSCFAFEPFWKQMMFFWRGGLALGRCRRECYGGDLVHHSMPCLKHLSRPRLDGGEE